MKNYPQILRRVYNEVWCITPEAHRAICRLLDSRLEGTDQAFLEDGIISPEEPEETARDGASIIHVDGVLGQHLSLLEMVCGGADIGVLSRQLDAAVEDANTNRIVLAFNSPGGAYPGIPELTRKIQRIDAVKPVYAFTDSVMCSGAYWLASGAREILSTPSSSVGSIGVYSIYLDESRALENEGLKVNAISAGKNKLMGASFKPMTDEERSKIQADVDRIHIEFKAASNARRKVLAYAMEGDVFGGMEALDAGLVTSIAEDLGHAVELTAAATVAAKAA